MSSPQAFIDFAMQHEVLRFGEFTLKSGRVSPYFFNAGLFNTGLQLAKLGQFYADAIASANVNYDMLFGPAYKGIPLAAATAIALAEHHQHDVPYAFNRKEAKAHGEGGHIVGAPLSGRVLMIDDVITAGTAFHEAKDIIEQQGASVAAVVIAVNRQERGQGKQSALQEIEARYDIPVISIIQLDDIIQHVQQAEPSRLAAIMQYREQYGCE